MNKKQYEFRGFCMAGLLILLTVPGLTNAQVPSAVEGPITSITAYGTGGAEVNVMGISIIVPADVFTNGFATTPTATLTVDELLRTDPLVGRSQAGFIGGTAIINGTSTLLGGFVADDFFVEAAETVLIGTVTAITQTGIGTYPCDIDIEGVPMVFSEDTRMPFDKAINGSGFNVLPCSVQVGNSVAGEGYYGAVDGAFHVFIFESDDAKPADTGGTTTITRASCQNSGRIEVRGSSTLPAGTVKLFDADAPADQPRFLGDAEMLFDILTQSSSYRVRENIGTCPQNVRAESWDEFGVLSSQSVAPVDIK